MSFETIAKNVAIIIQAQVDVNRAQQVINARQAQCIVALEQRLAVLEQLLAPNEVAN